MKLKIFLTNGQCVEVDAEIFGDWAVHHSIPRPGVSSRQYTVTHCPTLTAVIQGAPTKREAVALAKMLYQKTGSIKWRGEGTNRWEKNYYTPYFLRRIRDVFNEWKKNKDGQGRTP